MKLIFQTDKNFLHTISDWKEVNKKSKKRVYDMFASRGLVKEYIDLAYGEIDLLTALKMIK